MIGSTNSKPSEIEETKRGAVLVVEDDPDVASTFSRWVRAAGWEARTAASVAAALEALTGDLAGLIVDVRLPDGSGFEVVSHVRDRDASLPILVVTGWNDDETPNRAQLLGAEYACKPELSENVKRFLQRCRRDQEDGSSAVVAEYARLVNLTPAEARVVAAALGTTAYDALAATLDIKLNTLKSHVRGVLMKSNADTLEEVVVPLRARLMKR